MNRSHKLLIVIFFVGFALKAMENNEDRSIITKVSIDDATGEKIYETIYPLAKPQGLIRINEHVYLLKSYPAECKKIKVIIDRHRYNRVIVSAALNKNVHKIADECNTNSTYQRNEWIWCPWWDDTIADTKNYLKAKRQDQIRAGNRLLIEIREPGVFVVTIPEDADLETDFDTANIEYKHSKLTNLTVGCADVNYSGSSYGSGGNYLVLSSEYDLRSESDPITKLRTKNGMIILPEKS